MDTSALSAPIPAALPAEAVSEHPAQGLALFWDLIYSKAVEGGPAWESILRQLEDVFFEAKIGIYYYQFDTGQIYWSRWLFEMLGAAPGDPHNHEMFISRMVLPEYQEGFLKAIEEVMAVPGGAGVEYDYEFATPTGQPHWLRTRVDYAESENGPVLLGTTRDIQQEVDLKRARAHAETLSGELKQVSLQFEQARQGSPINVWMQDENLRYEWVFNRHKDYSDYDLIGKSDYELEMVAEMAEYIALKKKALAENRRVHFETWITPGEFGGARVYLRTEITPFITPTGERKLIGTNTDLTDQRVAQEAAEALSGELASKVRDLELSERRLGVAVEGSTFALAIIAPGGRLVWSLNLPEYAQVQTPEGLKVLLGGGAQQTLVSRALERAFATGTAQHLASWFDLEGKARARFLSLDIYPLPVNSLYHGEGVVGVAAQPTTASDAAESQVIMRLNDLTEWEQAQEQLRTSSERLRREQNETKAALASLVTANRVRSREIERARQLQYALLPKSPPLPSRLAFACYQESSPQVGGDYYDYRQTGERLMLAIGDAAGTGPLSTLVVSLAKTHVQLMAHTHDMPTIMNHISQALSDLDSREGGAGLYLSLGLFDLLPRSVIYCATAMPPLLIYRHASRSLETRAPRGMFLGTHLPYMPNCVEIPLEPGDIIVAMTDGLSESLHPKNGLIPAALLEGAIISAGPEGPAAVKEALVSTQKEWLGDHPLHDDTTLICFSLKDLV